MSAIRGQNTRPEVAVRKTLHAAGYRFRLHNVKLPGKPDIVLAKYKAIILVHGCFWHSHDCPAFKLPGTRPEFWREKLRGNAIRDADVHTQLLSLGWRVAVVWECALKGPGRWPSDVVSEILSKWLRSEQPSLEIRGTNTIRPKLGSV